VSPSYVRVSNRCGRKVTLHPYFPRPMKGHAEAPPAIVLNPNEVSSVVLRGAVVGCEGWSEAKDCLQLEDVAGVPNFIQLITHSRKPIQIGVKTRAVKRGKPQRRKIRISAGSKPRAIRADILADPAQVRALKRSGRLKTVPFVPVFPPSSGSYGYDDDFYICDDCGRPIVFRGSPPKPVHV
jgi:hypothetical protein